MNLQGLRSSLLLLTFATASLIQPAAAAEDSPHWRGNNRNGVVTEKSGWNGEHWINSKPDWTVQVGEGASSPLVVGQQVFTLGHRDGRDIVTCLEASTGKPIWTANYKAPKYGRNAIGDEGLYSGPSATPEFDPATKLLYTLSADGALHCWDTKNSGAKVWHRNLYDDYQMPQRAKVGRSARRDYGYTSAPLTHGDRLLVEVGGPTGTIVAFDKLTGKESWRSKATSVAGHSGGLVPLTVEGVPCVAALTFDGLLVIRVDAGHAGETVATYPWVTDFANNISSPAVHEDCVLITSAYNDQAMCKLRITLRGATKVWEQPVASKACTPVIHSGRIYLAWDRLRALDWESGKVIWEGPVVGDAGSCVVTADEKLIVWANRGELFLAEINAENAKYRELARVSRLAKSDVWPHLAVSQQQILRRDRVGNLMRFSLGVTDK
ncbi:outer membrane biogenesis protein BamB [Anatilimnocola aggregata]|uniref:Outer membrane biogenesis protein BamB n=1 Tax=Anatilimnocola aggregata TaxID=2528021 RepID=A0A517YFL5_9BACT|nr:PQQ-binding-like beta-propeller repeat protein [Anatilimnocola aggregata]QDU29018.1 outer membrane biogenesis protein BamB [Anatilimnocola aggregata]